MELSCLYFESIILIAVSYQGSHNSLTIFLDSSNDLSHVFSPEKGSPYGSKWGHDLKNLGWDMVLHTVDGRNPAAPDMYETL